MKSAYTKEELIDFETHIRAVFETGDLPFLVHLCGGNEDQLIEIFEDVEPGDWILSTHRSHYHYLLAGGSTTTLERMIRQGKSMFIYDKTLNFLTSSVLGGLCCVAAGIAASIKEEGSQSRVWCFVGDATEDEGHFYEAVRYVDGHQLPCTFVLEDNNRSCDTTCAQRRGTYEPFPWPGCVRRYTYTPTYPHGGTGTTTRVVFNPEIVAKHAQL